MPHYISEGPKREFKQVPNGTHVAVCNLVADLGFQRTTYKGEEKVMPKTYLRFETPNERVEYEVDGKKHEGPLQIGASLTSSLGEKATLRKYLESWRGKAFTQDELKKFDIFNLVGVPCLITVTHKESGGKTYANITAITGLPKGTPKPVAETPLLKYSPSEPADFDKLPKWLQDKIREQVVTTEAGASDAPVPASAPPADFDDDIPF